MNTHGEFSFKVRGYECGPDGKATFASLCNYMQEAAGLQAAQSHFAKQDFDAEGVDASWIITRMRVKITRTPRWWEDVSVLTFPRGGRKVVVYRDYQLRVGNEVIGCATSEWMLMNLAARRLVMIPERVFALANDEIPPVMGTNALTKLRFDTADGHLERVGKVCLKARRGDIDINGHVNNVRYIEWLVEALPADAGEIVDFEIAYKSETMAGDGVVAEAIEIEPHVYLAHAVDASGKDHVVARIATRKDPSVGSNRAAENQKRENAFMSY